MKDKKIILVDLDDTIEDLQGEWISILNNWYGLNVNKDNITTWDIQKVFPTLTQEQIFMPFQFESFWNRVKPYPDACWYLKKLFELGYNIYICTATHPDFIKMKYDIIVKKYFPYIDREHLIVTCNKKMIKCDYLIDDYHENLIGSEGQGILLDKPYNRCCTDKSIKRVNNWKEIYNLIRSEE